MKSLFLFVFAASLVATTPAPAPAPADDPVSDFVDDMMKLTTEQVEKFEVTSLGGMTFRADQVYNDNFIAQGRGQRAYLRSLRKYASLGAAIPPELMCSLVEIFQALGITGALSPQEIAACANAGTPGGNGTIPGSGTGAGGGSGTPPGTGGGTGTGGGSGTGGGFGGGNGTTRGNGTGSSQGSYILCFLSCLGLFLTMKQVRSLPTRRRTMWNILPLLLSARHPNRSCSTSILALRICGFSALIRPRVQDQATRRTILLPARQLQDWATRHGASDMAMVAVPLESSTQMSLPSEASQSGNRLLRRRPKCLDPS